jgi:hypothetical protein
MWWHQIQIKLFGCQFAQYVKKLSKNRIINTILNNAVSLGLRNSHFYLPIFFLYFVTKHNPGEYNLQCQGSQAFLCCEAHQLFCFLWYHLSIFKGQAFLCEKKKRKSENQWYKKLYNHSLFTSRFHLRTCIRLHSFTAQNASLPVPLLLPNYITNHSHNYFDWWL